MEEKLHHLNALDALILALLYANDREPLKGRLWLQKIVFILDRNIQQIKALFDGYYIGPYSEKVNLALESFISSGYIVISPSRRIYLSKKGIELSSYAVRKITPQKYELIEEIKEFLNKMNKMELIGFIYSSFPKYADKSDVYDEFLRTRLEASISLYKKDKVSLEKASEIAGVSLRDYINIIRTQS